MALGARCPTQIFQPRHGLEHRRHCQFADAVAETDVRAPAVVDVGVERAGDIDGLWVGEADGVVGGGDLQCESVVIKHAEVGGSYTINHDSFTFVEVDRVVAILNSGRCCNIAVEADRRTKSGALHKAKYRKHIYNHH